MVDSKKMNSFWKRTMYKADFLLLNTASTFFFEPWNYKQFKKRSIGHSLNYGKELPIVAS